MPYRRDDIDQPVPDFSREQLDWLAKMLTPRCCHVTATHDPRHYQEDRGICEIQTDERYHTLRNAIGLPKLKTTDAIPHPECSWCHEHGCLPERLKEPGADTATTRAWPASDDMYERRQTPF